MGFYDNLRLISESSVKQMCTKNKLQYLELILTHPGLSYKKLNNSKYLLNLDDRSWHLWPRSGRYQHLSPDGEASEEFWGELKVFYHRYLSHNLQLPDNFGKVWSQTDENLMYDMIEYNCTVQQIADELKRHPASVVVKLSKYLGDQSLLNRLTEDLYDVPLRNLT